jgi:hypothetical protein
MVLLLEITHTGEIAKFENSYLTSRLVGCIVEARWYHHWKWLVPVRHQSSERALSTVHSCRLEGEFADTTPENRLFRWDSRIRKQLSHWDDCGFKGEGC